MQILPLEKVNLKIKIHCVTEQEWNKLAPYFMFWNKNALRLLLEKSENEIKLKRLLVC